jgi:hypothetical protein
VVRIVGKPAGSPMPSRKRADVADGWARFRRRRGRPGSFCGPAQWYYRARANGTDHMTALATSVAPLGGRIMFVASPERAVAISRRARPEFPLSSQPSPALPGWDAGAARQRGGCNRHRDKRAKEPGIGQELIALPRATGSLSGAAAYYSR